MIVEFGLIKKPDNLVIKGNLFITENERFEKTEVADIWHLLDGSDAKIKISIHENQMDWMFLMPVHESENWEVIDLNEYFLQFKCKPSA